jgi:hypothetical protein
MFLNTCCTKLATCGDEEMSHGPKARCTSRLACWCVIMDMASRSMQASMASSALSDLARSPGGSGSKPSSSRLEGLWPRPQICKSWTAFCSTCVACASREHVRTTWSGWPSGRLSCNNSKIMSLRRAAVATMSAHCTTRQPCGCSHSEDTDPSMAEAMASRCSGSQWSKKFCNT